MRWRRGDIGLIVILMLVACGRRETSASGASRSAVRGDEAITQGPRAGGPPTREEVKEAENRLHQAAEADRQQRASLSFEEFRKAVYREPFPDGKYIVNGDTPILNDKQLREFFELHVKPPQPTRLIVNQISGMDTVWNQQEKRNLTFCISKSFGQKYDRVVSDMESATQAWEQAAAVDFLHTVNQDGDCSGSNTAVVFDVRPVNASGAYLARAFFPNEPRSARNVLIDQSALDLPASGKLQLVGILRHELGHTLGFRHEHTRPTAGPCFEDKDWRPLTDYDAFSVMHYPQCKGKAGWELKLTERDKNGSACLYGAASGFTLDPSIIEDASKCVQEQAGTKPGSQPRTEAFPLQVVGKGGERQYGPFAVTPTSTFQATIGGAGARGDADLYVRFGDTPALTAYDCRPFLDSSVESCTIQVPPGETQAFVMIHGYSDAAFRLRVVYVP